MQDLKHFIDTDIRQSVSEIQAIVERAGSSLVSNPRTSADIVQRKHARDLLLRQDLQIESEIVMAIESRFPNHSIVAEERGAIDKASKFTWIIDPLCGTNNYAFGYPAYGISLALVHDGHFIFGLIHLPERIETLTAWKGEGAFLNGSRVRVSQRSRLEDSLVLYDNQFTALPSAASNFRHVWNRAMAVRMSGSAAHDCFLVCTGRADARVFHGTKLVDFAAAATIVREAGGEITELNGTPLSSDSKGVLISNRRIHSELAQVLGGDSIRNIPVIRNLCDEGAN